MAAVKFDPAWKDLNKDEKFSLLKNPGKYTLVVKVYNGASVIKGVESPSVFTDAKQQEYKERMAKELEKQIKKNGKNVTAQGFEAHQLAEVMRNEKFNYDAWVFHTAEYSMVTIGAFDRPDDPKLLKLKALLKGQRFGAITLAEDPAIMEVPRP